MKLIRDKIPALALARGETVVCHRANFPAEFRHHLYRKLTEEARKFSDTGQLEELVELLEVIRAIAKEKGLTMRDLYHLRDKIRKERGGFESELIWDEAPTQN